MVTISLKELIARRALEPVDFAVYDDKLCVFRQSLQSHAAQDKVMKYPVRTEFFSWVFIEHGDIIMRVGLEDVEVSDGMMCFCRPGNMVSTQSRSDLLDCCVVMFDPSLLDGIHVPMQKLFPYMAETQQYRAAKLDERCNHHMKSLVEMLKTTIQDCKNLVSYNEMVMSLISYFFYSLLGFSFAKVHAEAVPAPKDMRREQFYFRKFMNELHANFVNERKIGFYADRVCVSPKYLSSIVRSVSGRGPSQWIDECVVGEAKNLLRFSDLSIQEISNELHFPTQSYFGRYFKRHTGMSPRAYRQL